MLYDINRYWPLLLISAHIWIGAIYGLYYAIFTSKQTPPKAIIQLVEAKYLLLTKEDLDNSPSDTAIKFKWI